MRSLVLIEQVLVYTGFNVLVLVLDIYDRVFGHGRYLRRLGLSIGHRSETYTILLSLWTIIVLFYLSYRNLWSSKSRRSSEVYMKKRWIRFLSLSFYFYLKCVVMPDHLRSLHGVSFLLHSYGYNSKKFFTKISHNDT